MPTLSESTMYFASILLSLCALTSASAMAHTQQINTLNAQVSHYEVEDFSPDYKAVVMVDEHQDEKLAMINIIDKATGQTVLSQPISIDIEYQLEMSEEMNKGKVINANITQLPYGHFSGIIYDDFNFDNQKDIAIKDGQMGCYGGPSYQVYLKQGDSFVHSNGFTALTQGYCGFFYIDKDNQTLHTMTKSGAAWHQYSTFKIINNEPVAVQIIEQEWQSSSLINITEKTRVNGEMQVEEYKVLPDIDLPDAQNRYDYSYRLSNAKIMVLGSHYNNRAYYAFADRANAHFSKKMQTQ